MVVFTSIMEAPGKGIPVLSRTVPVSFCCSEFEIGGILAAYKKLEEQSNKVNATKNLGTKACNLKNWSILFFIRIELWICTVVFIFNHPFLLQQKRALNFGLIQKVCLIKLSLRS